MDGLIEGRMVHYVMHGGNSIGQHRPAIVVNAWGGNPTDGRVNLQVFTDFGNDGKEYEGGRYWATSAPFDDTTKAPGTWHWIERA